MYIGKIYSSSVLKNIAYITMFIDHIAALLLLPYLTMISYVNPTDNVVYASARAIGRVSFVIFAFLVAEGICYSRKRELYLLRLFLFSLISEVPFDLANNNMIEFGYQNVFFNLTIGASVLYCIIWLDENIESSLIGNIFKTAIILLGCCLSFNLKVDYSLMGVLLIVVMFLFRGQIVKLTVFGGLTMYFGIVIRWITVYRDRLDYELMVRILKSPLSELYGMVAFLLIARYNGKKGRQLNKFFYYMIYPAHLLILWIIRKRYIGF